MLLSLQLITVKVLEKNYLTGSGSVRLALRQKIIPDVVSRNFDALFLFIWKDMKFVKSIK
jgi:hypothetical protein